MNELHRDDPQTVEPVYYYNRARRLEHASDEVRALYNGKCVPEKGLLKVLISTKRNRYLFASIVLLCIIIIARVLVLRLSPGVSLGGAVMTHECFVYENAWYVSISIAPHRDAICTPGVIAVRFSLCDDSGSEYSFIEAAEMCQKDGCTIKRTFPIVDGARFLVISVEYNNENVTVKNEARQNIGRN